MTLAHSARPSLLRRGEALALRALHRGVARWYLRKPDLAELLEIKFPSWSAVLDAGLQEWAYRRRRQTVPRVLSLNVETTNYCNLACTMCPVNNGMVRTKKHLDPAVFRRLIDQTPGLRFVLPFQWGEPLLHPEIHHMIRYAADRGVRSMLTTNGTLLDDRRIDQLLDSGLARLTVSVDGDDDSHEAVRGQPLDELRDRVAALRQARDRRGSSMRIDASMVLSDDTRHCVQAFRREWSERVDRVQIIPLLTRQARSQPCREAWRGSLVVLVDGTVTACCVDSEGSLALGHVERNTPAEILNDAPFRELRRRHRCGDFPEICAGCGEYDGREWGISARFGE